MRKLVKIKEVMERIPFSRSQIYKLIAEGRFPKQVHLGGHASFWLSEEIDEWIESHLQAERKAA